MLAALLLAAACATRSVVCLTASHGHAEIEYFVQGEGLLVILLPSASRGAEDLEEFAGLLARGGMRVARPQPRGAGASLWPTQGLTLHDFGDDVAAVICAEGTLAIVAGHAYGNWVARVVGVDHPDLVRAIVLIAAARKGPVPPELLAAIAVASDSRMSRTRRTEALRQAFFAEGNDPSPYLGGWRPELRDMQRSAAAATPQAEWWGGGAEPLLEIQAAEDPFLPRADAGELRAELGERVTTIVIDRASHAVVAEHPEALARAITQYAQRLTPAAHDMVSCP